MSFLYDRPLKKIAVVGAGIGGLALAYKLRNRCCIDVYEKYSKPGGLAQCFELEGTSIEAFFHHFFLSDTELISLINELNLTDKITYQPTTMGIYYKEGILPFSNIRDLLLFKKLSFHSKILFGLHMLYLRKINSWRRLESLSIRKWMERFYGKEIYEKIWVPLLHAKFEDHVKDIPMSWLWGRIHPRSASRRNGKELLGYLKGSLSVLFDALVKSIVETNGNVFFDKYIEEINVGDKVVKVRTRDDIEEREYDLVVMAVDTRETLRIVKDIPRENANKLKNIEYYGVICMVLLLKDPLGNIYWLNNADMNMRISGIVEHTNFIKPEFYNNKHIAYVFKYLSPEDTLYVKSEDEIYEHFYKCVKKIYQGFDESQVITYNFYKTSKATPVYKGAYSRIMPTFEVVPGKIYMLNTSQIYPEDRNLNNGIKLANRLVSKLKKAEIL